MLILIISRRQLLRLCESHTYKGPSPTGGPNSPEQLPSIIMTRRRLDEITRANPSSHSRDNYLVVGSDGSRRADLAYCGGAVAEERTSKSSHKRRSQAMQDAIDDISTATENSQIKRLKEEVDEERRNGWTSSTAHGSSNPGPEHDHYSSSNPGRPPRPRPRRRAARSEDGTATLYISETEAPDQSIRQSPPPHLAETSRRYPRSDRDSGARDSGRRRKHK